MEDSKQKKNVTINKMEAGQSGMVIEMHGGENFKKRLEALGIRPGSKITKVSSMVFRGPSTVKIGRSQIAIGFGMANRVIVEVDKSA